VATSALQIMDRTIKPLGEAVRERVPITDMELPQAMRRLIAELERRDGIATVIDCKNTRQVDKRSPSPESTDIPTGGP
jgi:hypothetical protein